MGRLGGSLPALATALLGLLIAVIAAVFDSASLYVPGVALLGLGLVAAAWVAAAGHGATIARTLGPATVVEGEPYAMRVEVRTGLLPAPGGTLVEPMLAEPLGIAGRRSRRVRVNVRFSRRGRRTLEPCRLSIRDPLRLAERARSSAPGEVLVLPRIEPVRAAGAGSLGDAGAALGRDGIAAQLEIDSLRPYREGTPASRIHWPTLARTGAMMERRLMAEADARPLVVLDPRGAASEDDLDAAVRAAASLCHQLAKADGCGLLLPGERRPTEVARDLRAWPALHVRLALVEADDGAPVAGRLDRGGAIFWVSARRSGLAPTALRRSAAGSRYLVAPGAPEAGALSVAGCRVRRIGSAAARAVA